MGTNRTWRLLRHQLLASRGQPSVKDSFQSKARIATAFYAQTGSSLCFCREEEHLVADRTPEGKAQGRGEEACPPRSRRRTLFPQISKWKISQLSLSLLNPNATPSSNWSRGTHDQLSGRGGSDPPEGQLKPFLVTHYKARESQTSASTKASELSHSYLMGD